jgi:hypothetical protein
MSAIEITKFRIHAEVKKANKKNVLPIRNKPKCFDI